MIQTSARPTRHPTTAPPLHTCRLRPPSYLGRPNCRSIACNRFCAATAVRHEWCSVLRTRCASPRPILAPVPAHSTSPSRLVTRHMHLVPRCCAVPLQSASCLFAVPQILSFHLHLHAHWPPTPPVHYAQHVFALCDARTNAPRTMPHASALSRTT
mmetsp:Transcript_18120/g.31282  ORF Transcript_18120/g.31282 Transcript_18120/m.31282 type:complete len:156 (+) Transcript_18120:634-1101(+)